MTHFSFLSSQSLRNALIRVPFGQITGEKKVEKRKREIKIFFFLEGGGGMKAEKGHQDMCTTNNKSTKAPQIFNKHYMQCFWWEIMSTDQSLKQKMF